MIFTYQCTGIHPGLWSINIKSEGSESTGAEPKLKSSMVLVKMEGLVCRLETDGDNRVVRTPHPDTAGLKWLFVVQEIQTVLQQIQNNSNTKNYHKYQKTLIIPGLRFCFVWLFCLFQTLTCAWWESERSVLQRTGWTAAGRWDSPVRRVSICVSCWVYPHSHSSTHPSPAGWETHP